MDDWLCLGAKPGIAICSASNSSSSLKIVDSKVDAESLKLFSFQTAKKVNFSVRERLERKLFRVGIQVSVRALFCRFSTEVRSISNRGKAVKS